MSNHAGDTITLFFNYEASGEGKTGLTDIVTSVWHISRLGVQTLKLDAHDFGGDDGAVEIGLGFYAVTIADAEEGQYIARAHTEDPDVDEQDDEAWQEVEAAVWAGVGDTPPASYYCTYADMQAEITSLADVIPDGADAEDWVYHQIATAQQSIIDPALMKLGYTVPLASPAPDMMRGITINAAAYTILRPLHIRQDANHNPDWVDTYLVLAQEALALIPPAKDPDVPPGPAELIFGTVASTTSGRPSGPFSLPQFTEVPSASTETW